jgi:predicted RNase H-like nuclease
MSPSPDRPRIAGVDGCPGGWIMVQYSVDEPSAATWHVYETFKQLHHATKSFAAVTIDMPIGLPDTAEPGGRLCDRSARAVLGARQSSVFAVPARAAIACDEYRAACTAALRHSDPPRKVARQTFNLFPKIREIDALMTPALQNRIVECHPEVAFWALNDKRPLGEPKKVRSSPYPPGLALRRALLSARGYLPHFLVDFDCPARVAAPDDLLDACAAAWTANRLATGQASRIPAEPPLDPAGLRMEIVY